MPPIRNSLYFLGTHTDWEWEDRKKIFQAAGNKKKGLLYVYETKENLHDIQKKSERRSLSNNRRVDLSRNYSNHKYICTQKLTE